MSKTLQEFKDNFAKTLFGMSKEEAIEKGICIGCKKPALANCHSDAGRREYQISGLCERCFDRVMGE
jgi:hypothetical protein